VIADALATLGSQEPPKVDKEPAKVDEEEPKVDEEEPKVEEEDEKGLTEADRAELTAKMQKAIGKKHRALKEAEEFATDSYNRSRQAEERAEKLAREVARLQAQLQGNAPAVVLPQKPARENFKTDDEYQEAMVEWKVDEKLRAKQADDDKRREAERIVSVKKIAGERVDRARELVPDYDDVVSESEIRIPKYIETYMVESEMLAELGYHFAKNPDEFNKIAQMRPEMALVAIGKIESKLQPFGQKAEKADGAKPSKETVSEPSPKPRASEPITPIKGGEGAQVEKPFREMNYREARADYEKKSGAHLSRRQRH
jgi:hypothetical protein